MEMDVRPSIYSFFVVGVMAVVFILVGKIVFSKYYTKGLSEIFSNL